jgi:hypothetical protein
LFDSNTLFFLYIVLDFHDLPTYALDGIYWVKHHLLSVSPMALKEIVKNKGILEFQENFQDISEILLHFLFLRPAVNNACLPEQHLQTMLVHKPSL